MMMIFFFLIIIFGLLFLFLREIPRAPFRAKQPPRRRHGQRGSDGRERGGEEQGGGNTKPAGFGVKCCRLFNMLDSGFYFCKVRSIFVVFFFFLFNYSGKELPQKKKKKRMCFLKTLFIFSEKEKRDFFKEFSDLGQSRLVRLLPKRVTERRKKGKERKKKQNLKLLQR